MYALFFFSAFFTTFVASESPWTSCHERNSLAEIISVKVENCDGQERCLIKRGENATITVKFSVPEMIKNPERVVYAVLKDENDNGKPIEIPHGRALGICSNLGKEKCVNDNLMEGKIYNHNSIFQVPPAVPKPPYKAAKRG